MAPSQPLPEPPARFTELLQRHRGILVKVAGSYARQREDREDLAQEIAAQLWRAWPGYDPARPFSTWMYRIALNVAISQLRGRARTPTLQAAADDPLDTLPDPAAHDPDRAQQVERLYRFIHALPPLDRALNVFSVMTSNIGGEQWDALETELSPILSAASDEITFNEKLFQRIKAVADGADA
ncbi:MAG: sigma-70 family RNA polymerase sigma factor, partial [Stenotrophomonas nitritireducens]|nr:sigma-70 family RNA polymerase sigma factor [Stenotrophomonas nitritireducens]